MEKLKKDENYRHILRYTGIFGSVQGLNILVGIVRNKFTALFLGPSGMGLLSLFNSTSSFLVSACNLGIPTSGVKMVADSMSAQANKESLKNDDKPLSASRDMAVCLVRSFSFLAALLGLLVCIILGPLINLFSFSWGNHTLHFILLAPTVFFTILAGGEMAVLKALGELKALAMQSLWLVVLSLLFSVPIYGWIGESGILAVLFLLAFSQWALNFRYSRRAASFRLNFSKMELLKGIPLLRLGLSFVLAGMANSGAEFLVRAFLNMQGDLEVVGLFNAGVSIVIVYAGMVFSVMESDYYPRLSTIVGNRLEADVVTKRNLTVNQQLETNVLLMGPIVAVMILALPVGIPILYDSHFMGMLGMAQVASISMLFKALYLPVEYLPLSRGESKVFLVQETLCVLLLVVSEIVGYLLGGLYGLGVGIAIAYGIEAIAILVFSRLYYGYRLSTLGGRAVVVHLLLGLFTLGITAIDYHRLVYWGLGVLGVLASSYYSFRLISRNLKNS